VINMNDQSSHKETQDNIRLYCCHCGRDVDKFKIIKENGKLINICPHCGQMQNPTKK